MDKITILSNEEFETRFGGDQGYSDCMFYYKSTEAVTCRIIEAYKAWKEGSSLDDILYNAWNICYDTCFDEDSDKLYIPQGAYDFYKKVVATFEDDFCDDKE